MTDIKNAYRPIVVVRGVIESDKGILIVKRSESVTRPGEWEFPGGKVDRGETLEQAIDREVVEETNLEIISRSPLMSWSSEDAEILGLLFDVHVNKVDSLKLSPEHMEYAWVDRNSWNKYEFSRSYYTYFNNRYNSNEIIDKNTAATAKVLRIFTDGGSRGNPGPSATGYVVYDQNDNEITQGGTYLGITTNNQAEYHALKEAAEIAVQLEPSEVHFFLDSQLVVNQMTGKYKIKNKDLWPVHQSIQDTLVGVTVKYSYVTREENTVADAMVNEVLDNRINKVE